MKTYVGSCVSYSISELSEAAQEKAYQKWYDAEDPWDFWWDEAKASLEKFCNAFDIKLRDWQFDGYTMAYWKLELENDALNDEDKPLSGVRLAIYIWNNYAHNIQKGKYYSLFSKTEKGCWTDFNGDKHESPYGKLKSRHSHVMIEIDNCPLTGVYYDASLLDSVIACLHYKKMYDSYEDLMNDCLYAFFKDCMADYEYHLSKEYFMDGAEANEWEYASDGSLFHLPNGLELTA